MMNLAIVNSFICLLMILFFREKPKKYPSISASEIKNSIFNFKEDFGTLMKNTNFLLLNVPFVMSYSVHHTMSAVLSSILTPYDYDEKQASYLGITYIMSGIIGAFYFSNRLD